MTVGDRIKQCRESLGLSVEELAKLLGKHRATIYRYESNDIEKFPTDVLEPLATVLQTTPAYLMGWETKSGETDLGLVYLDLAEMFHTTPEAVEAATAGMSFPNGIDLAAIKEISQRLQKSAVPRDSGLTVDEQALLEIYRSLTPERREKLATMVRAFVEALR